MRYIFIIQITNKKLIVWQFMSICSNKFSDSFFQHTSASGIILPFSIPSILKSFFSFYILLFKSDSLTSFFLLPSMLFFCFSSHSLLRRAVTDLKIGHNRLTAHLFESIIHIPPTIRHLFPTKWRNVDIFFLNIQVIALNRSSGSGPWRSETLPHSKSNRPPPPICLTSNGAVGRKAV